MASVKKIKGEAEEWNDEGSNLTNNKKLGKIMNKEKVSPEKIVNNSFDTSWGPFRQLKMLVAPMRRYYPPMSWF